MNPFPKPLKCAGKTQHMTRNAALKELRVSNGRRMKVFKCPYCAAYHIGHDHGKGPRHTARDKSIPLY